MTGSGHRAGSFNRVITSAIAAIAVAATSLAPAGVSSGLTWSSCAETMPDWQRVIGDTRMECTYVTVPMDYAKPAGRQIRIAVSRLKASDPAKRRGVLLGNPGGPGPSSISYPLDLETSTIGGVAKDHDMIGFDTRGAGFSDKIPCDDNIAPPEPATTEKAKLKAQFDYEARWNKLCGAVDTEFAAQLTTANVARDMDMIRAALGEPKISFYGASWGTAIGALYRSMFDSKVDKMWLESVMPPKMDLEAMDDAVDAVVDKNFGPFTEWLAQHDYEYHFGTTKEAVQKLLIDLKRDLAEAPRGDVDSTTVSYYMTPTAPSYVRSARELAVLVEGGTVAPVAAKSSLFGTGFQFDLVQNRAVICNEATGGRDFETIWAHKLNRKGKYPAAGGMSTHAQQCPEWPVDAQQWQLKRGTSPLQLSGHLYESTTPYVWAKDTQAAIGGSLLTILDDQHGSIRRTDCGSKVVEFFTTGRTFSGLCGGQS